MSIGMNEFVSMVSIILSNEKIFNLNLLGTVNTTNYVNPNGPVYLTNGSTGSPEESDQLFQRSNDSCFLTTDPGFGKLTFFDPSHATFTFYRISDMAILDQVQIIKNR